MTESKLDPLQVLKDDLQDEDHAIQIEGAKRLVVIAKAIGPQRTRRDLVECLQAYVKQENDEALVAIGQQMAAVSKLVGGSEHMGNLIPLLENLIFQEETVVCDAASTSLADVIGEMNSDDVEKTVIPSLERMANAEWFQPRVGVSKLLHRAYPKADQGSQEKIMKWFSALCKDENPMVKKSALINMGSLSSVLGKSNIRDSMISKLKEVCAEDSDLMRLHAVDICKEVAKSLDDSKEFVSLLWPVVQKLSDDASWRVRKQVANAINEFAKELNGQSVTIKDLINIYLELLKDKEPEVKVAAAGKIVDMCRECKSDIGSVAQVVRDLIEDPNQQLRTSVSTALGEMAALADNKTTESLIFDIMKVAVKDEDYQVRCNTLESIQKVAKELKTAPSALLAVVQPFASDPKWRVRRQYLRTSTAFAAALPTNSDNDGFETKLITNLIECLSDHISSIREEACVQLAVLVGLKGGEWGVEKLLPEALKSVSQADLAEQSNYITRMTGLILVAEVSQHLNSDQIEIHVWPFIETCLKDGVENVRFKAARTAAAVIPLVSKAIVTEKIVPALEAVQKGEQDQDILFYSEQALHLAASD
mmetsp:Transcript_2317/g.4274  ORF Transcript_2317/g.4274 Transcript_2317/m.4274 type:complete len:592 (+) Transcript_2317:60-1835(+)|eukprot:CAMPEP_0197517670 /NCGR_PEP_ID=MMETSP1318-20131121/2728_1 /TAXON_ID=552666 /ORGANISM="Partenskyella glossopodia, Strain RCC365" /LENGTH=591 /DNA_ID=CAMNT_0043067429 /DNA_START=16 /DNA_END=1791 /DNA_ORIENTATION=+